MGYRSVLRRYYLLSKPGIIYANVMTAGAGYLFASQLHIEWRVAVGLLLGLAAVIAGACAFNNYLDRGRDAAMQRTKQRGLVTGDIGSWQALTYASVVTLVGFGWLLVSQNRLTSLLVAVAFVDYVVFYGITKRKTSQGTLIGCIAGAIPLVAGYTAVTGRFDRTALLLFALMVAWQMAHFYGIALYRLDDYRAARLPVMPAQHGVATTRLQAVVYMGVFIILAITAVGIGSFSLLAGGGVVLLGLVWLIRSLRSYNRLEAAPWGRQVFLFSLLVILGMSGLLALNPLLV